MECYDYISFSIAYPSEKGGYNEKVLIIWTYKSIAYPSEKGGYNEHSRAYRVGCSIAYPSEKGGYNIQAHHTPP